MSKDERHLSGSGTTERNTVGFVIHNNGSAKADFDSKLSGKADVVASVPSPTATKTTVTPAIGCCNHAVDDPAKSGPMINGTSVGRPGANLSNIGGSTKNIVGTLSDKGFKPKHP